MLTHPIEKLIALVSAILVENDYKTMLPGEIQCDLDNLVSVICIGNNGHAFKTHAPSINRSIDRLMDYASHYHDSAMSKFISYGTPFESDWVKLLSALRNKQVVTMNEIAFVIARARDTSKSGYQLINPQQNSVTKTFHHVALARLAQITTAATIESWIGPVSEFTDETIRHARALQSLAGYDDRFANFTSQSETQISISMKYLMDVVESSDMDLINRLNVVNLPEGDPWMRFLRRLDQDGKATSDGLKYSVLSRAPVTTSSKQIEIVVEEPSRSNSPTASKTKNPFRHPDLERLARLIAHLNIRVVLDIPPIVGNGESISQQIQFVIIEEDGQRELAHRFISETASGQIIESRLTPLDWSFEDLMAYSAHLPAEVIDSLPKTELVGDRWGMSILRELDEGTSIAFLQTRMHLVAREPDEANPCSIAFVYGGKEPNVSEFLRYSAAPISSNPNASV